MAKGILGDLTDEAFCRSVVKQTSEAMGGLDILANVAGKQTHQQSIADIITDQFDATLKTNVYGLFLTV